MLIKNEAARIGSRFLKPACGSGDFFVQILRCWLAAGIRAGGHRDPANGQRYRGKLAPRDCYP